MRHGIRRVTAFDITGPYTLRLEFDDGVARVIDFRPILSGRLYGPLRELDIFNRVRLDAEAGTLVWPNGADFDPATLHDWPDHIDELKQMAKRWENSEHKRETG